MDVIRFALLALVIGLFRLGTLRAQDIILTKPGDRAAGDDVFIKCSGCHQDEPGATNSIGPELNGIVGRMSGFLPAYDYSAALKSAEIHWNHDALAAFVTNAKQKVPETKMAFAGLKDAQDVEDLIAYLSQFDDRGEIK